MHILNKDHHAILGALNVKGVVTSFELQEITGKSQPTVSRLLGDLSSHVLTLGRGRATLYGLPKSIRGLPSQQPVFWVNEDGVSMPIGMFSFLAGDIVHVESDLVSSVCAARLPWFLSPLRAQGFLGRLLA